MIPLRRKILLKAFKTFDVLNISFCLFLAASVFSHRIELLSMHQVFQIPVKVKVFAFFLVSLLTWHIVFSIFALYRSKRFSNQWKETVDVIKATSFGSLAIYIEGILLGIDTLTPVFLVFFWIISTLITILSRLVLRYLLRQIRIRGRNLRHVLVIGTNPSAIQFAQTIIESPQLGYRVVGFVDNEWPGIENFRNKGFQLVCDFKKFPDFVRNHVVDEVVLSLPVKSLYDRASQIVSLCEEQGIVIRYLSNIFNMQIAHSKDEQFQGYQITGLHNGSMGGWQIAVKRIMDFSLSLISLLVFLPLFIATALAIMLMSPGPVFFIQERVGLNKRRFRLYKFRTMVPDAEEKQSELEQLNEVSGPVFKIKDDPRITPVGRFLRKTSIDELPQLINVLKGDMSLVGPRPLPVRDYEGFDTDWHRRRFSVRPGITCLWQAQGRSSIAFEKWMKLDLQYIDQWSLWFDIKFLIKTIPAVVRGTGSA